MIKPVPESEFRSNKEAVKSLAAFLSSKHGLLLQGVLLAADPIEILAGDTLPGAHTIRDEVIAEKPNPDSLLGMSKHHRRIIKLLQRCSTELVGAPAEKPTGQHRRVLETMRKGPPEEKK